jgi:hypothetical protein
MEGTMILTKSELVAALQNESRILLHLASKIDGAKLDREELNSWNLRAGVDTPAMVQTPS